MLSKTEIPFNTIAQLLEIITAEKIEEMRVSYGLSAAQMATQLGFSHQNTYYDIRAKKKPISTQAAILAAHLSINGPLPFQGVEVQPKAGHSIIGTVSG